MGSDEVIKKSHYEMLYNEEKTLSNAIPVSFGSRIEGVSY